MVWAAFAQPGDGAGGGTGHNRYLSEHLLLMKLLLLVESSCQYQSGVTSSHTAGTPAGRLAPEGHGDVPMIFRFRKSFRGPCFRQMYI